MQAILHNIRSAHNVGSIFRTADAAGISKLFLCGYTPAPVDEYGLTRSQIAKVALGGEKSVAWEKAFSVAKLIVRLHKDGKTIYAVEQSKRSTPFHRLRLSSREFERAVLVMGNEVKGLAPAVLRRVDKILEIPMFGKKESLNVAVAFGIVAYGLKLGVKDKRRGKR
jgi:23S rRNA (guanosine2251-2'-O)-methyltransferase